MKIKDILRNWVFAALSQPRNIVKVELPQIQYGGVLKDKNIVITGGSRGIGYAMASKFISEGANVIITGRNEHDLMDAVQKLGSKAQYIKQDSSLVSQSMAFIQECNNQLGHIDSLVLNAGISLHEKDFTKVTIEGYEKQFDINLKANYFLSQAYLDYKLIHNEQGNLLFLSSETAGKSNDIPYGLTKNAINSLVGGLARRVYQKGIRVNAIAPGVTYTDMTKGESQISDDYAYNGLAGRYLLPEEIAEVACFLLSNVSNSITGEIIYCDGGSHLKINGNELFYTF